MRHTAPPSNQGHQVTVRESDRNEISATRLFEDPGLIEDALEAQLDEEPGGAFAAAQMAYDEAQARLDLHMKRERLANAEVAMADELDRDGEHQKATELVRNAAGLFDLAAIDVERARIELERARRRTQRAELAKTLAVTVRGAPQQQVMTLGSAVHEVAAALQATDVEDFVKAVGGDPDKGELLRQRLTFLALRIRYALGEAIATIRDAERVAQEIVDFVSGARAVSRVVPQLARIVLPLVTGIGILAPFCFHLHV
jgi:hypothetical protein